MVFRNVGVYASTRYNIPEDLNIQQHLCEDLKSLTDLQLRRAAGHTERHTLRKEERNTANSSFRLRQNIEFKTF